MNRLILSFSRLFVGALFIFSGLVKLNDPMGFAFKLHDYFAPDVLNLPFLDPFTLPMSVFIVVLEVVLGIALLIGYKPKLTVFTLLGMIVFFTFLTFYSAYFNKVTDCGCFGDAIPLTPWQSFTKDIILLFFILILFKGKEKIKPLFSPMANLGLMGVSVVLCGLFANHVLNHLPVKDFRAYAIGKSIPDGMKHAEELGLEGPVYETYYVLKDTLSGDEQRVSGTDYINQKWYEKKQFKMLTDKTESVKIKEGYEPPIHDFSITTNEGDITETVLGADAYLLVIAYDVNKGSQSGFSSVSKLMESADAENIPSVFLTASLQADVAKIQKGNPGIKPVGITDGTTLKTIIRSVPGVVLLKKGVVVGKWHHNDTPDIKTVLGLLQ